MASYEWSDQRLTVSEAAWAAYEAGLAVVPPAEDGSKRPLVSWKRYQHERPSREEMRTWYGSATGVGLICGAVSGHLELFEFEARAIQSGLWDQFRELAVASGLGAVLHRVSSGYSAMSPTGGLHLLLRTDEALGSQRLAVDESGAVLIETRGERGYAIAAPTNGQVHPSGRAWEILEGSLSTIASLSVEERDALYDLASTFNRKEGKRSTTKAVSRWESRDRPGDVYNQDPEAQANILNLLEAHGWTHVWTDQGTDYLRRPGKDVGVSATLGHYQDPPMLIVFSTSTEFDPGSYTPFAVYAQLEHGGDYSAAAKALKRDGFDGVTATARHEITKTDASSWTPIDLSGVNPDQRPTPTVLLRRDLQPLLYPGVRNVLFGPPESGKTWIAAFAVSQVVTNAELRDPGGQDVKAVVIDHEDTEQTWVHRLQLLGLTHDDIARRVAYVRPDQAPQDGEIERQLGHATRTADLVVVDSMNESMYLLGLDPVNNADVGEWRQRYLKPLEASTGDQHAPAIFVIDHTASQDTRDRLSALGAQTKLSGVRGVQIKAVVMQQPAPGQQGRITLYATKDPNGAVRAVGRRDGERLHLVGTFFLEPLTEDVLRAVIIEPQALQTDATLRHAILDAVDKEPEKGLSKNQIEELVRSSGVKVANETLRSEIQTMSQDGELEAVPHGNYTRYRRPAPRPAASPEVTLPPSPGNSPPPLPPEPPTPRRQRS